MAASEAQKRATKKWQSENTEEIKLRVRKGEKSKIQQYAAEHGESVNALILRLVRAEMDKTIE